jgi:hypothetical protein
MPSPRPWHRRMGDGQSERCEACGCIQNQDNMIEPMTEGMRGYLICGNHGFLSSAAMRPSYNDMLADGPAPEPFLSEREPPFGLEAWYEDDIGGPGDEF